MTHDTPTARAIAPRPDLLDTSMGGVRNLEGEAVRAAVPGLRRPSPAAEGGDATSIFKFGGCWHARRQLLGGRLVMGIGYTKAGAIADLESQWEMA